MEVGRINSEIRVLTRKRMYKGTHKAHIRNKFDTGRYKQKLIINAEEMCWDLQNIW